MVCRQVRDGNRQMAVAVAQGIGIRAAFVDRQFKLEVAFRIAHVDEREGIEIEPVRHVKVKGGLVELH